MTDNNESGGVSPAPPSESTGWYVLFVLSVVVIGYFALRSSLQKEPDETPVTDHAGGTYDAWGRSPEIVAKTLGRENDPQIDMGLGSDSTPAVNETADSSQSDSVARPTVSPPAVVTPSPERTYVVQAGDVLGEISRKMYGTTRHSGLILKSNPVIKDPDFLKVGMTLKIPLPPSVTPPSAPTSVESAEYVMYTVVKDDSSWVIAEKLYGKGHLNSIIVKDNPERFKDGKSLIKPGDQLKIRRSMMKQP